MVYTAGDWTVTTTEAGAGSASEAIGTAAGGQLVLTNDDADNDLDSLQLQGESFLFAAGKKAWFETRFKVSDATQSDLLLGLVITDTTPLAHTDGVVFRKDDGDTNLDFESFKDSAGTTQAAVTTLSDDTFVIAGFYYDGAEFHLYINGEKTHTLSSPTIPDDEELTVTMHIQNGEAAAKVLTVDYILAAIER